MLQVVDVRPAFDESRLVHQRALQRHRGLHDLQDRFVERHARARKRFVSR